jgi:glycosyltransferase involved in cell wall biosynthesis
MKIDLIIPARNEEQNIPALLAAIPREQFRHIIIVDNGSTDSTAQLAHEGGAVVVREDQRGYGAACLAGLRWIDEQANAQTRRSLKQADDDGLPDIVAFLDADLADDPALLPQVCQPIIDAQADMVIASRPRHAEPGSLTMTQRVGNAVSCRMIRMLTGVRYTDLGPMRAVRWSSLERMAMADRTWGWTVEMQYKAASLKLRTREIDTPYRRRHAGRSKISGSLVGSAKAGWKIMTTILHLWIRDRKRHSHQPTVA